MQEEIVHARYQVKHYRSRLDELWMELETATTWEHINTVSKELSESGLAYKTWKKRLFDLTDGNISASIGA
jgi:hypothetical protein